MIKALLAYQFVFLFSPVLIISLTVFGSDFKGPTGWVYVAGWSIISLLHLFRRWWAQKVSAGIMRVLLITAIPIGVMAYRQIHLGIWDEHSLTQAMLISLLAVLAYLGSVFATLANNVAKDGHFSHRYQTEIVLLLFSVCWLVALVYPQFAFFATVLLMGLGAIWLSWTNPTGPQDATAVVNEAAVKRWAMRYLVFVLFLDAGLVVWDYKVNLVWAGHLAVLFLAAAFGVFLSRFLRERQLADHTRQHFWVIMLVGINMAMAMSVAMYTISIVHSSLLGIALGFVIAQLRTGSREDQQHIFALWPFVVLGLLVGNALYAQLSVADWRILLVLPLLIIAVKMILKNRAAI